MAARVPDTLSEFKVEKKEEVGVEQKETISRSFFLEKCWSPHMMTTTYILFSIWSFKEDHTYTSSAGYIAILSPKSGFY